MWELCATLQMVNYSLCIVFLFFSYLLFIFLQNLNLLLFDLNIYFIVKFEYIFQLEFSLDEYLSNMSSVCEPRFNTMIFHIH